MPIREGGRERPKGERKAGETEKFAEKTSVGANRDRFFFGEKWRLVTEPLMSAFVDSLNAFSAINAVNERTLDRDKGKRGFSLSLSPQFAHPKRS